MLYTIIPLITFPKLSPPLIFKINFDCQSHATVIYSNLRNQKFCLPRIELFKETEGLKGLSVYIYKDTHVIQYKLDLRSTARLSVTNERT